MTVSSGPFYLGHARNYVSCLLMKGIFKEMPAIHWGLICYPVAETQSSLKLKISSDSLTFLREENSGSPDHSNA